MKQDILARIESSAATYLKAMTDDIIKATFRATNTALELNDGNYSFFCDGVKFFYKKGSKSLVVIETPPGVRTISIGEAKYSLSFPYVYFCIVFGETISSYCTFSNKKLQDGTEPVLIPCLPNIEKHSLLICRAKRKGKPVAGLFNQAQAEVQSFWHSSFDFDGWDENYCDSVASLFKGSIGNWASKSNKDPMYGLKVKWLPLGKSYLEFISETLGYNNTELNTLKNSLYRDIVNRYTNALIDHLDKTIS